MDTTARPSHSKGIRISNLSQRNKKNLPFTSANSFNSKSLERKKTQIERNFEICDKLEREEQQACTDSDKYTTIQSKTNDQPPIKFEQQNTDNSENDYAP